MYSELEVMSSEERIMNDNDNNKEIDGVLHYENYVVKFSDVPKGEAGDWFPNSVLFESSFRVAANNHPDHPYDYDDGEELDGETQFLIGIPVGYFDHPKNNGYSEWRHGVREQLQQKKESDYLYPAFGDGPVVSLHLREINCPDVPMTIGLLESDECYDIMPTAEPIKGEFFDKMRYYSLTHSGLELSSVVRAAN